MFPVFDPEPKHIKLMDIAHALSNECRWQGMCRKHFSVAEHSIWVGRMAKELAEQRKLDTNAAFLYSLIHDAHEAYLSDIPKPLKDRFAEVKVAAGRIDDTIYDALNLKKPSYEIAHVIHECDNFSAWIESKVLFYNQDNDWTPGAKPYDDLKSATHMMSDIQNNPQSNYVIRDAWLSLFGHYRNQIKEINS